MYGCNEKSLRPYKELWYTYRGRFYLKRFLRSSSVSDSSSLPEATPWHESLADLVKIVEDERSSSALAVVDSHGDPHTSVQPLRINNASASISDVSKAQSKETRTITEMSDDRCNLT